MSKKKYHYVGCLILTLFVCGCHQVDSLRTEYLARFEEDYRDSVLLAPLKIPEDLSYPSSPESYPLPDCLQTGRPPEVSVEPPGFGEMLASM